MSDETLRRALAEALATITKERDRAEGVSDPVWNAYEDARDILASAISASPRPPDTGLVICDLYRHGSALTDASSLVHVQTDTCVRPRAAPSGEPAPDTATDLDLAPVAVEAMMQQAARLGWDAIHRLLNALNPEKPRPLDDEAKTLASRALRELRVFAPFGSPLAAPSPVESAPCTGCGLRPEDEDGLCDECRAPVESGEPFGIRAVSSASVPLGEAVMFSTVPGPDGQPNLDAVRITNILADPEARSGATGKCPLCGGPAVNAGAGCWFDDEGSYRCRAPDDPESGEPAASPVESDAVDAPSAEGDDEDGEEECQCPEGFHVGAEPPPEGCGVEPCESPVESGEGHPRVHRTYAETAECPVCCKEAAASVSPVESGERCCATCRYAYAPSEQPPCSTCIDLSSNSDDATWPLWVPSAPGETPRSPSPTGAAETRECPACQRGDPCPENDRIRASPEVNAVRAAATALRDRMRAIGDDDLPLDVLDALDALDAALNYPEGR